MNKKYEYNCIDLSILTPFFRDHVTAPVLKYIPLAVHPNLITIVSFLFSLCGLIISFYFEPGLLINTLISSCIFMYLLFDHLDGMQAKRRGGGSPLGEWMDHFLDVLVNGIVMLTMIQLFDIDNTLVQILILSFGYISQAMVFLEQRESGTLHFGKVESLEAVLLLCVVVITSSFEAVRDVMNINIYELRLIDLIMVVSSMTGLRIIMESYTRIGLKIWPISILIVSVVLMTILADYMVGDLNVIFIIAAAAIIINQEYLIGHLTGKQNIVVDFFPIVIFSIGVLFNLNPIIIIGIIALVVLVRFILTVNSLRKYNKEDFE